MAEFNLSVAKSLFKLAAGRTILQLAQAKHEIYDDLWIKGCDICYEGYEEKYFLRFYGYVSALLTECRTLKHESFGANALEREALSALQREFNKVLIALAEFKE